MECQNCRLRAILDAFFFTFEIYSHDHFDSLGTSQPSLPCRFLVIRCILERLSSISSSSSISKEALQVRHARCQDPLWQTKGFCEQG